MDKRRVLLVCSQTLFGETLEILLRKTEEVELLGPFPLGEDIEDRIVHSAPDVVVIADGHPEYDLLVNLTAKIMGRFPHLHVIRTDLDENIFHLFTAHTLPASSHDLIDAILRISTTESAESWKS